MENDREIPSWPARVLVLVFAGLGFFVFPPLLERFVSLTWQIGNVRNCAWAIAAICILLAVVSWTARHVINRRFGSAFPSNRKLVFALVAVGLSVLFSLVCAEFCLRFLEFPFSASWTPSENALARFDEELGWSYIPNNSASQQFGSDLPFVTFDFDESGIRVADRQTPLDRRRPSVLFVGCSFTMGHGLQFEETFIAQLQAMEDFPLQCVNLGVQGFGTDQSLLQLQRYIDAFNTKVVVYTFMHLHVRRNACHDRRILFPEGHFLGTKPLFGLGSDGKVFLKKRPKRYQDMVFIRVWGIAQGIWAHWGPAPTDDLTRALVLEMKQVTEARGAQFFVIDWAQDEGLGESPLSDLDIQLIDTGADAPEGWLTWKIPEDLHPDQRANRRVAQLIREKFVDAGAIP